MSPKLLLVSLKSFRDNWMGEFAIFIDDRVRGLGLRNAPYYDTEVCPLTATSS